MSACLNIQAAVAAGRQALADARAMAFEVRGLTLRALAFGPPDGRPVLALHGWLDNAHSFAPLAAALPGCHLVALEVSGHGHSDHRSPDAEYHIMDYVCDVHGVLEGLRWRQATLMGHSMGACVMTLVAGALQARTKDVVLLDGLGPLSCSPQELPTRLCRHIDEQARLAQRVPRCYPSICAFVEQAVRVVPNLAPQAATLLAERGLQQVAGGFAQRADLRLRGTSGPRMDEAQVQGFLAAITAPVLLVQATQGFLTDSDQLSARMASVPHLTVHRVEGGHHVHMDRPVDVAQAIDAFWAAHSAQAVCMAPPVDEA